MKRLASSLVLTCAAALAACASQSPVTGKAGGRPGSALTASAATSGKDKVAIPFGYRRVVVGGQEQYCRSDVETGSRVAKHETCLTLEQLQAQEQDAENYMQQAQRAGAVHTGTGYVGGQGGAMGR